MQYALRRLWNWFDVIVRVNDGVWVSAQSCRATVGLSISDWTRRLWRADSLAQRSIVNAWRAVIRLSLTVAAAVPTFKAITRPSDKRIHYALYLVFRPSVCPSVVPCLLLAKRQKLVKMVGLLTVRAGSPIRHKRHSALAYENNLAYENFRCSQACAGTAATDNICVLVALCMLFFQ